jgi:HK97 family phage prohead protease
MSIQLSVGDYKVSKLSNESGKDVYRFKITDERLNRNNWITLTSGIDYSTFMNNPVVLLQHDSWWEHPIGKVTQITIEGTDMFADIVFHEETEASQVVKKLVDAGVYNATSIGIDVLEETLLNNNRVFTKSELLEVSIVTIPANGGATFKEKINNALKQGNLTVKDTFLIESIIKNHEGEASMADNPQKKDSSNEALELVITEKANLLEQIKTVQSELDATKQENASLKSEIEKLNNDLKIKADELASKEKALNESEIDIFISKNANKIFPKEKETLKAKLSALKTSKLSYDTGKTLYEAECELIENRTAVASLGNDIELSEKEIEKSSFADLSDVDEFNKQFSRR